MSAPHKFAIESQHIGYGFLASSLAEILRSRPERLDDHSVRLVHQAVEFLDDVVRGAEVVSQGECGALTTEKSIEALGYAIAPISVLQNLVSTNDDFVGIFKEISAYLATATETKSLPFVNPNEQTQLERATTFFEALAECVLSSLSTARMREAPDALP
jgi:hypothetical protein